jgi:translation initiation factor 2-alpha kinase 4
MEYCGGKTLKSMIDKGLPLEKEEKIWCVFREILQGLNHIHEQGMIHRDLKPSNVLIDHFGHAKIGDFGLATTKLIIQKENHHVTSNMLSSLPHVSSSNSVSAIPSTNNNTSNLNDVLDSTSLSGAVGTALYVAPDLLTPACKNKFIYTQKVDIYSLGIMLYEMFFAFPTNMERIYVLQNLRLKEILFDQKIDQQAFAKQIKLLKAMLNHDPTKRPSVKDLLMNDVIPRKADEIALEVE